MEDKEYIYFGARSRGMMIDYESELHTFFPPSYKDTAGKGDKTFTVMPRTNVVKELLIFAVQ